MKRTETHIDGLVIIAPQIHGDERGWFYESFNADKLRDLDIHFAPKQASHSSSRKGILRGLHFQNPPKPMAKLVRCTRGRLFDVAVDLRSDSPTYKEWFGLELSAENKEMLLVPAGFAHGFYALEDCELQYLINETYNQELDAGIAWNDPEIAVDWPLEGDPILSARDQTLPTLSNFNNPF